jgi:hypothetical protein
LREVRYKLALESQAPIKQNVSHSSARPVSDGVRSLMLAVFEDGIRTYCRGKGRGQLEAERWVWDRGQGSPFSFNVICEVLGLEPSAVRVALPRLQPTGHRVRPNARLVRRIKPARRGENSKSILSEPQKAQPLAARAGHEAMTQINGHLVIQNGRTWVCRHCHEGRQHPLIKEERRR